MQMAFFYQSVSFDVYTKIQKAPHEYSGFSKTEKENYVINPSIEFHLWNRYRAAIFNKMVQVKLWIAQRSLEKLFYLLALNNTSFS